jgi:hypothetical protein
MSRILESLLEKRGGVALLYVPKIVNALAIAVTPSVLKSNSTLADAEQEFNNQKTAEAHSRLQFCFCLYHSKHDRT